jgi:hypothetical protein
VKLGKTGSHELIPAPDGQGVRSVPVLAGTLFVHPSGTPSGYMLVLRVPVGSDFALITTSPEDVLYCTHIVPQSKIIQSG